MKLYEDIVKDICMVNWDKLMMIKQRYDSLQRQVPDDIQADIDGWVGVSIMLAYLVGEEPTVANMANHFSVNPRMIEDPLRRLKFKGVFSQEMGFRKDPLLIGTIKDTMRTTRAWCNIAGVSSGLCS